MQRGGGGQQKARANSKREAVSISIKAPHARHDRLTSLIVSAVLPFARISCPYIFFFAHRAGHSH
jgi:hypothetical protein